MSQMVRTQIYLPRDLYDRLRRRGAREGIPMAEHIRKALRLYLDEQARVPEALADDDPLWSLVGVADGPTDGAENHDHYIYGAPKKRR